MPESTDATFLYTVVSATMMVALWGNIDRVSFRSFIYVYCAVSFTTSWPEWMAFTTIYLADYIFYALRQAIR